jgi:hypothetical protein
MPKSTYQFEDFLSEVSPEHENFATDIHKELQSEGYKAKIESKASGFFVSYSHPKTKRSILNFFFRKSGMYARIYVDNAKKHESFLDSLPAAMEKELVKSAVCKRMLNIAECNPKCMMGYTFELKGTRHQKCRYGCFGFLVASESVPFISDFIKREREERAENI